MELPHDPEAEASVLAAILDGRYGAMEIVRKTIPHPLAFFVRDHRYIAIAAWDLDDSGRPSDAQAVYAWLAETASEDLVDEVRTLTEQINGHTWTGRRRLWSDQKLNGRESGLESIGAWKLAEVAAAFKTQATLGRYVARLWELYLRRRAFHETELIRDAIKLSKASVAECLGPAINRLDAIVRSADTGTEVSGLAKLHDRIDALASGRYISPSSGYPILDQATQWLCAGSSPAIAGPEKSGKSWFVLCALMHLISNGVSCSILNIEEDCAFILRRALAVLDGNSNLLSDAWMASHQDETKDAAARHRDMLLRIQDSVLSIKEPTIANAISVVRGELKRGRKVVFVDPVSLLSGGKNAWDDAKDLVWSMKKMAEEYGAAVVLVNHTAKNNGPAKNQTHAHAGGAALTRFASVVLTLQKSAEPERLHVDADGVVHLKTVHRRMRVVGARNGPGDGVEIAMDLCPLSVRMSEIGKIVPEDKAKHEGRPRRSLPDDEPSENEDLFQ
jgi:replicative DNA helicase